MDFYTDGRMQRLLAHTPYGLMRQSMPCSNNKMPMSVRCETFQYLSKNVSPIIALMQMAVKRFLQVF